MADKNVMKISKEKAAKVFEYFGFKMAAKWPPEKMTEKLNNLIESIDPKVKIKSKSVRALVKELTAADSIVVTEGKKKDKDAPKEKSGKKDKAKGEKKTPAKKRGITRLDAATKVLMGLKKKGLSVEEAAAASDELCVKDGGTSNMNEAKYSFKLAARVLEVAEVVVFSEDRSTVKPA